MALNISSGATYVIANALTNTVMDINGDDHKSVVGFKKTGSKSQQWTITYAEGWYIKNVETGRFLAFDAGAGDGASLIITQDPFTWHIWPDASNPLAGRIRTPSTTSTVDLDMGSSANGTHIIAWSPGGDNQVWRFELVHVAAENQPKTFIVTSSLRLEVQ